MPCGHSLQQRGIRFAHRIPPTISRLSALALPPLQTALHAAARLNNLRCCEVLLDHGASLLPIGPLKQTALQVATSTGSHECMRMLEAASRASHGSPRGLTASPASPPTSPPSLRPIDQTRPLPAPPVEYDTPADAIQPERRGLHHVYAQVDEALVEYANKHGAGRRPGQRSLSAEAALAGAPPIPPPPVPPPPEAGHTTATSPASARARRSTSPSQTSPSGKTGLPPPPPPPKTGAVASPPPLAKRGSSDRTLRPAPSPPVAPSGPTTRVPPQRPPLPPALRNPPARQESANRLELTESLYVDPNSIPPVTQIAAAPLPPPPPPPSTSLGQTEQSSISKPLDNIYSSPLPPPPPDPTLLSPQRSAQRTTTSQAATPLLPPPPPELCTPAQSMVRTSPHSSLNLEATQPLATAASSETTAVTIAPSRVDVVAPAPQVEPVLPPPPPPPPVVSEDEEEVRGFEDFNC